jgi:hypothetical protein
MKNSSITFCVDSQVQVMDSVSRLSFERRQGCVGVSKALYKRVLWRVGVLGVFGSLRKLLRLRVESVEGWRGKCIGTSDCGESFGVWGGGCVPGLLGGHWVEGSLFENPVFCRRSIEASVFCSQQGVGRVARLVFDKIHLFWYSLGCETSFLHFIEPLHILFHVFIIIPDQNP